jgi:transcriptional regulator GlxA family with amidase domain
MTATVPLTLLESRAVEVADSAALVCPEVVLGIDGSLSDPGRDRPFDELLQWIQAHLHTPITATELSRRSAYSLRNLQHLFQRRFGCSPMQWVKRQRLEAVHRDLQRAQPRETVAVIARRHFGIPPSVLLRRSRIDAD